jgi:tRNA A37 threonylcarbamoyladenosine synthetase subunit TsaC/SUA5/YrdC
LFGLGNLLRLAEHFSARSLVEASGTAGAAESFENPGRSEARNVARVLGEVEAQLDVTLGA